MIESFVNHRSSEHSSGYSHTHPQPESWDRFALSQAASEQAEGEDEDSFKNCCPFVSGESAGLVVSK